MIDFVNIVEELKLEAYLLERKAIQLIKECRKFNEGCSADTLDSIK